MYVVRLQDYRVLHFHQQMKALLMKRNIPFINSSYRKAQQCPTRFVTMFDESIHNKLTRSSPSYQVGVVEDRQRSRQLESTSRHRCELRYLQHRPAQVVSNCGGILGSFLGLKLSSIDILLSFYACDMPSPIRLQCHFSI